MLSLSTISLWILNLWILFAAISANPVYPSSTEPRQRLRQDPNAELDQAPMNHRGDLVSPAITDHHLPPVDDSLAHLDDGDDAGMDEDEFGDDVALEEELFKKLEGSAIPKRVVKILKVISENDDLMDGKGNTVRSYMPTKREACAGLGDAYVFTLRPMRAHEDPEDLKYAELHFYAKNFVVSDELNAEEVTVSFYYVAESQCQPLGIQIVKIPKNGWLITDVTSVLNHHVLIDSSSKITIAMYVRDEESAQEDHRSIANQESSHERLVKPFVFVYTEDTSARKGNAQSNWQRLAEKLANREADSLIPDTLSRRRRNVHANDTNETLNTNAVPLHPVGKPHPATTQTAFSFFAEQNMRRIKSSRRRARKQRQKQRNSKNMMLESEDDERARARKKNINKPRPKHMDMVERPSDGAAMTCELHTMNVDFQSIGWDDYIIAPTRFEASYCAGQCSFPIAKELHPSNHAIIQSIMQVLGVQVGVPTPCCVPERLEPLSLLYIDEESKVSLKMYSDMQVVSCGCN